ncbi:DUF1449 family protein [Myroides marinus]|uniref:DUF1449 domain-containing protein n=1 Tax=Myroides marinus TaxID=703342 RepID=A0A1H6VBC8_9FLAO|nr:OB-fold-containig protein [Myroides marinus]MDM1348283.1 DUF1449 family protein [Myroides marinus]MDM1351809.1 DUF1449 family protein [Myroides marinus]MDM1355399.1 DUF1449 family protein [Myroides marinus]MDM1359003.1 DUF1449 family protein [Myroides marinus]MDM1366057.1 DUF1449 family protein [Myroides marinus]
MTEILHHLFNPLPNAIMSVLMGISFLYWIFSAVLGGFDGFDIDMDVNPEIDVDVDMDVDTDFDLHQSHVDISHDKEVDVADHVDVRQPSVFMQILEFMNVGKIPFMIILTIFKFFTWAGTLLTTTIPKVVNMGFWSVVILIPLSFVAIILTHYATLPLVKFLKDTGYHGEKAIDFIGQEGIMLSSITENKHGNMEIVINQDPIKILVESTDGNPIKYGDKVIIINKSDKDNVFLVRKTH